MKTLANEDAKQNLIRKRGRKGRGELGNVTIVLKQEMKLL